MGDLKIPLKELNDWLKERGTSLELYVIGAFALHLHGLISRYTMDVDTISLLDEEVLEKVREIGLKYGLPSWLNNQARTVTLPEGLKLRALSYHQFSHLNIKYAARGDLIKLKVAAFYYRKDEDPKDLDDLVALNPTFQELEDGLQFLKIAHLPEVESFQKNFLVEVAELEEELKDVLRP